ncbi:MAG TPA: polysaccharide biosynthesis tyrosine autokinase [Longimicrobiales bacterium]
MDDTTVHQTGGKEERVDLLGYWHLLRRNRGLVFAALAFTVAVSALITSLSTPIYRSVTSLRIEDRRTDGMPAAGLLSSIRGDSEIETEMEVLRSRTLAEEVVDALDLNLVLIEPAEIPRQEIVTGIRATRDALPAVYRITVEDDRFRIENETTGSDVATVRPGEAVLLPGVRFSLRPEALEHDEIVLEVQRFDAAVSGLRGILEVERPNREASIVTIAFEGPDPFLVRAVTDAIARHFIRQRTAVQKTAARSTVEFLRSQIDTIAIQLVAAENALQAFREGELVVSLDAEARARVDHLADFEAERNATAAERAALAGLLADIRATAHEDPSGPSPYRRLIAFPTLFRNNSATDLLDALTELENQRALLLNRRTAKDPDVQVLTDRIHQLEEQLRVLATTYLQGLTNQVASLDETLDRIGVELERIPAKETQYARLERQTNVLEQIYTLLQTRLKEAEIAEAVEDASVRVVDGALPGREPVRPRPMLNVALAVFFGLILGIGGAYTRERLDDTVNTRDDIQAVTGVPVLGLIPRIRRAHLAAAVAGDEIGHNTRLITGYDPQNPVSEAYRSLRTNITFARPDAMPRTLVVTSPTPGDGKTTSAANLAVTLALQDRRVLLIDADMRRGVLNMVFDTPRDPGLSDVLMGAVSLENAVRKVQAGENSTLEFLSTGTLPPNPAELLGSSRMSALLERLEKEYDAIIIDSPPLNMVTDAAVVGRIADGVLIVVRAGKTEREGLNLAMDQLNNARVSILGAVLNDASARREGRYYNRYGYYQYAYTTSDGEGGVISVRPLLRWVSQLQRRPPKD